MDIKRVEVLKFPKWKDVKNKHNMLGLNTEYVLLGFSFESKNNGEIGFCIYNNGNGFKINITGFDWTVYFADLTKENYIKACRICKNLFLGVENG